MRGSDVLAAISYKISHVLESVATIRDVILSNGVSAAGGAG